MSRRARPKRPHILIKDHGLPYSRGLMASSLSATGLPMAEAFRIAEEIEEQLLDRDALEVSGQELRTLAADFLGRVNERYSSTYLKWQAAEELDVPLVILIGGVTGVGKSTTSTQLAARLGISRVISTDAVREVLRSAFSRELMPTLYESSFNSDVALPFQLPKGADRLIIGFQRQAAAVAVGMKALIARATEEGTDMIIEGAHVVPGFVDAWEQEFKGAVLVPMVMMVNDEDLHRSHFHMRALETRSARHSHYLAAFGKIRRLQEYVVRLAEESGIPRVEAFDLDSTLEEIVTLVVEKALSKEHLGAEVETEIPRTFEISDDGGVIRKKKLNRLRSWEMLPGRRKPN